MPRSPSRRPNPPGICRHGLLERERRHRPGRQGDRHRQAAGQPDDVGDARRRRHQPIRAWAKATADLVSTKPLLIRPVTPRFFVVGDKAQLAAIVNNNTDSPLHATVALSATGVTLSTSGRADDDHPRARRNQADVGRERARRDADRSGLLGRGRKIQRRQQAAPDHRPGWLAVGLSLLCARHRGHGGRSGRRPAGAPK